MTKMNHESTELKRTPFRPDTKIDKIANYPQEPGYHYETIIYDYNRPGLRNLVEYHENIGFEVCYTKEAAGDNRNFKPDSGKENSTALVPCIRRTSDGYHEVLMRIPLEKYRQHHINRSRKERERFLRSVGKNAKSMNLQADKLQKDISVEGEETVI